MFLISIDQELARSIPRMAGGLGDALPRWTIPKSRRTPELFGPTLVATGCGRRHERGFAVGQPLYRAILGRQKRRRSPVRARVASGYVLVVSDDGGCCAEVGDDGHPGGCHCGNLRLTLRLTRAPATSVARLRCGFCRAHATARPATGRSVEIRPLTGRRWSATVRIAHRGLLICRAVGFIRARSARRRRDCGW